RGEGRGADPAGEGRVPRRQRLELCERVQREPARALEPALVARERECLQERVAVAGGPVAEPRALAEPARLPGQLGSAEQQLVVEELADRRDDARRAVAPLHAHLAVALDERAARTRGPRRELVLPDRFAL